MEGESGFGMACVAVIFLGQQMIGRKGMVFGVGTLVF